MLTKQILYLLKKSTNLLLYKTDNASIFGLEEDESDSNCESGKNKNTENASEKENIDNESENDIGNVWEDIDLPAQLEIFKEYLRMMFI